MPKNCLDVALMHLFIRLNIDILYTTYFYYIYNPISLYSICKYVLLFINFDIYLFIYLHYFFIGNMKIGPQTCCFSKFHDFQSIYIVKIFHNTLKTCFNDSQSKITGLSKMWSLKCLVMIKCERRTSLHAVYKSVQLSGTYAWKPKVHSQFESSCQLCAEVSSLR